MLQDHNTNMLRADFGSADTEFFFDLGSKMVQLSHVKTEVLRGRAETSENLETIKGFAGPVSLHNNEGHFLDTFKGCKSSVTGETFPSPTDRRAIICRPGIDNLVIDT